MARPSRARRPPASSSEVEESIRGVLRALALMGVFLLLLLLDIWLGTISQTTVAIGAVKSVSAESSSLFVRTIIETETAFYSLRGHATIQKGAPLVLDVRLNGDEYVCDIKKEVCARASSRHLTAQEP